MTLLQYIARDSLGLSLTSLVATLIMYYNKLWLTSAKITELQRCHSLYFGKCLNTMMEMCLFIWSEKLME
jgi:hypothetical protein